MLKISPDGKCCECDCNFWNDNFGSRHTKHYQETTINGDIFLNTAPITLIKEDDRQWFVVDNVYRTESTEARLHPNWLEWPHWYWTKFTIEFDVSFDGQFVFSHASASNAFEKHYWIFDAVAGEVKFKSNYIGFFGGVWEKTLGFDFSSGGPFNFKFEGDGLTIDGFHIASMRAMGISGGGAPWWAMTGGTILELDNFLATSINFKDNLAGFIGPCHRDLCHPWPISSNEDGTRPTLKVTIAQSVTGAAGGCAACGDRVGEFFLDPLNKADFPALSLSSCGWGLEGSYGCGLTWLYIHTVNEVLHWDFGTATAFARQDGTFGQFAAFSGEVMTGDILELSPSGFTGFAQCKVEGVSVEAIYDVV